MKKVERAFLADIGENLYDDAPRLIFADWLEDNGQPERAEFIRVQCELEPIRDQYEIPRAKELHDRENTLIREHRQKWLGPKMKDWCQWREDGAGAEFRRGFVDTISMPVETFLKLGTEARTLHPTIRRLELFRVHGQGKGCSECDALEGLAELELSGWYSDEDAEAIATSPHLGGLEVLQLWLGRQLPLRDSRLCRIMGGSAAWPNLRELVLLNPDDNQVKKRKRLTSVVNKAAGRKLGVYTSGWPELYPFAEDFWYLFPGYLSDGRMAIALEQEEPPSFQIITFDQKGKQTEDVLTVPLPEDLAAIPPGEWDEHKERIKEHLIDTIGFRPDFIRVGDFEFPGGDLYNSPFWSVYSMQGDDELFGDPTCDDSRFYADDPRGFAGGIARRMKEEEYVLGWDRYADKRGRVHST